MDFNVNKEHPETQHYYLNNEVNYKPRSPFLSFFEFLFKCPSAFYYKSKEVNKERNEYLENDGLLVESPHKKSDPFNHRNPKDLYIVMFCYLFHKFYPFFFIEYPVKLDSLYLYSL